MSIDTDTTAAIRRYSRESREVRLMFANYPAIAATAEKALLATLSADLLDAVRKAEFVAVRTWDPEHPYGCPWCGGQFTDLELRSHHCPETTKINDPHAERAHDQGA